MFRFLILSTALSAGLAATGFTAQAQSGYVPPALSAPADDGWQTYTDAPDLTRASVAGLSPTPDTPEAAVTLFLASRLRGDSDWKDAMADDPGRRGKKALNQWKDWTLTGARLLARKDKGASRAYVRVQLELKIDGDSESGSDDFEVIAEGNGWRVKQPPS